MISSSSSSRPGVKIDTKGKVLSKGPSVLPPPWLKKQVNDESGEFFFFTMVGTGPAFYKVPVTKELSDPVISGRYPGLKQL